METLEAKEKRKSEPEKDRLKGTKTVMYLTDALMDKEHHH